MFIRNDLSYNVLSVFPCEIKNVFFEILWLNSKAITGGTIYDPPHQSNFLEALNENLNKIDSISIKIYIIGEFNINFCLNELIVNIYVFNF